MKDFIDISLSYITKQISIFDTLDYEQEISPNEISLAREKMNFLFGHIQTKYSKNNFQIQHLNNSDYYAIFLYWLSFFAYRNKKERVATKIYLLNKMLHGIDLYFTRKIPDIVLFSHPIGSILGDAHYSNYLCISQGCTIGGGGVINTGNHKYPQLGQGVILHANVQILGDCRIGDNVIFGANTFVLNMDIPSNSVVVGQYPNIKIHKNRYNVIKDIFKWKN